MDGICEEKVGVNNDRVVNYYEIASYVSFLLFSTVAIVVAYADIGRYGGRQWCLEYNRG